MLFSPSALFMMVKIDSSLRPPLPFVDLVINTVLFFRSLSFSTSVTKNSLRTRDARINGLIEPMSPINTYLKPQLYRLTGSDWLVCSLRQRCIDRNRNDFSLFCLAELTESAVQVNLPASSRARQRERRRRRRSRRARCVGTRIIPRISRWCEHIECACESCFTTGCTHNVM